MAEKGCSQRACLIWASFRLHSAQGVSGSATWARLCVPSFSCADSSYLVSLRHGSLCKLGRSPPAHTLGLGRSVSLLHFNFLPPKYAIQKGHLLTVMQVASECNASSHNRTDLRRYGEEIIGHNLHAHIFLRAAHADGG